ncbi:MAG: hypothetical protein RL616_796 [Verrucomicrobiota bacterium]|jgi:hypothetical protein
MTTDSNSEISALKNQVFIQLVALIVVTGTLVAFLYRQASVASKDLESIKPQALLVINTLNQNQGSVISFVNEIVAYGEKHPDFQPVLAKYGIAPVAGHPAVTPAAPAAPKK